MRTNKQTLGALAITLILIGSVGSCALGPVSVQGPFSTVINYPVDLVGKPDSRATTWGLADAATIPNKFNAPPGFRVRVLRFDGNFMAWARGEFRNGQHAGVSWGFKSTAPDGSVRLLAIPNQSAGGADNCFAYFQYAMGEDGAINQAVSLDTHVGGLLASDGTLLGVLAVFLNDSKPAIDIHMELQGTLIYQFERE